MYREARQTFISSSLILIALLISLQVHADEAEQENTGGRVYKHVAPDGTITYTDRPSADSKEVKVPKGTEYTPPKIPAFTPSTRTKPTPSKFEYDSLTMTSPKDDQAIWDNTGNITAAVALEPGLQAGHSIEFLLDGVSAAKGSATSHQFLNVDRGTHQITARVVDNQDEVIATTSVTFHMRRTAIGP